MGYMEKGCIFRYENKYMDEKCLIYVIFKGLIEHTVYINNLLMKINWVKEKIDLKLLLTKTQRTLNSFV